MKNAFDFSFADEDAEPAFKNACENKNREKAKKRRNKKKSKNDKKSAEDADFSAEQECMTKRVMSSFRNHLDDSRSRNQIFKKQQCHACDDFHLYKRYYYLFSSLAHEN